MLRLVRSKDPAPHRPLDTVEDGALMVLTGRGDARAFAVLVERHEPRVRRYLSRMVGNEEARDLSQETFVSLWQRRERYREEGRFTVLLYRIARSKALSHLRWRKVRRLFAERASSEEPAFNAWRRPLSPDALDELLEEERDESLCRLLQGLPLVLREAVVLHHAEGLDYATIGEITGVPLGTLRARAHRGLLVVRERLARRESP